MVRTKFWGVTRSQTQGDLGLKTDETSRTSYGTEVSDNRSTLNPVLVLIPRVETWCKGICGVGSVDCKMMGHEWGYQCHPLITF